MLGNKFNRHTVSFVIISLASVFLYIAAQHEAREVSWALIAIVIAAALLTLLKE